MPLEDTFKPVLKSQYHAALAMLRDAVERCPDDLWTASDHLSAFWQVAYHCVFFTHLYLHTEEAAFRPWPGHQRDVQHGDGLTNRPDPESTLPLLPAVYSKSDVLDLLGDLRSDGRRGGGRDGSGRAELRLLVVSRVEARASTDQPASRAAPHGATRRSPPNRGGRQREVGRSAAFSSSR